MLNRFRCRVCALALCFQLAASAAPVKLKQTGSRVEVEINGKPFTAFYFGADTAKTYLMPLQTAHGMVISRPFPVGNDVSKGDPKASSFEPHQRPLYFAHGNIDGLNFWAEPAFQKYYGEHSRQAFGKIAQPTVDKVSSGDSVGSLRATFALVDPNGRSIGKETQVFTFRGDDKTRTIDCSFTISASAGPITFGDTKEGTFAIRLGPELSAPLGQMLNSAGGHGEKEIWGKPADWVNYSGAVSGQRVGIAVFDHPKSFRHPTTWHARGYGLLAANPFGWRAFTSDPAKDGSWTVPEGGSIDFRYRVVIYDGDWSPSEISEAYRKYAAEP